MNLWKLDTVIGTWRLCRTCEPDTAQAWLIEWQKSEPGAQFALSERKPVTSEERQLRRMARERKVK